MAKALVVVESPAKAKTINKYLGKDDTIYAKIAGRVKFENHGAHGRVISIQPVE